jgi:hypothetical protein
MSAVLDRLVSAVLDRLVSAVLDRLVVAMGSCVRRQSAAGICFSVRLPRRLYRNLL